MDCLQYMLCMKCYEDLAGKGDVLMCTGCGLWQHTKCAGPNGSQVTPDFYLKFYLSVTLGEKPQQWSCDYCSSHKIEEEQRDDCSTKQRLPSLRLPPTPCMGDMSEDSDDDELKATFDVSRSGREGLTNNLTSISEKTVVTLIPRQKIFLDDSPTPVTYTLQKELNGCKVILDCHSNKYHQIGLIKNKVETYECAQEGCKFQVRVCVSMMQFLVGYGDLKHSHYNEPLRLRIVRKQQDWSLQPNNNHETLDDTSEDPDSAASDTNTPSPPVLSRYNTPSPPLLSPHSVPANDEGVHQETSEDSDSDSSANIPFPPPAITPYNTPAKHKSPRTRVEQPERAWPSSSSDSSNTDDDGMSPVIHYKKATLAQPTLTSVRPSISYCSGTTDGSGTEAIRTPAIQRFAPLTTPKINKSSADFSFSSSSDSSYEDLNITHLCERLAEDSDADSGRISGDSDIPPPSPSDTIPACHSDDSNDGCDDVVPPTVYTVTEGIISGGRTKLTDNQGYSYQIKFKLGQRIFWTCTEKPSRCSATVIQQRKNKFTKGAATHNHLPNQSTIVNTRDSTHSDTALQSDQCISPEERNRDHVINSAQTVSRTTENLLPSKSSATVNQSKQAKIVTGVRTVKGTAKQTEKENDSVGPTTNNIDNAPAQVLRSPNVSEVVYEEVMTNDLFMKRISDLLRPCSVLVDSSGYVFNRRLEDGDDFTTWQCIKRDRCGQQCGATVKTEHDPEFNCDYEKFVWVKEHKNRILTMPHNHLPDKTEMYKFKLKAYIHQQVFGYCDFGISGKDVVRRAIQSLHLDEREKSSLLRNQTFLTYAYNLRTLYKRNKSSVLDKFACAVKKL